MFKIILKNLITNKDYIYSDLVDMSNDTFSYQFKLPIASGLLEDGEYHYWLVEGEYVIYDGLLRVGEYKDENKEYNNNNKKRKQYNG